MNLPRHIVSNQTEEFISIQRVKAFHFLTNVGDKDNCFWIVRDRRFDTTAMKEWKGVCVYVFRKICNLISALGSAVAQW